MKRYNTITHLFDEDDCTYLQECESGELVFYSDVESLQAELDEYKAHTEDMRKTIETDIRKTGGNVRLENLLFCTPAQSLSDVKAKAVMDMLDNVPLYNDRTHVMVSDIERHYDKLKMDNKGEG